MEAKEFGNFISQIRKEKGLTQAELAARINVTDKAVSRWERGLGFPDINTLDPLAEALNISIMELMRSCRREAADNASNYKRGCIRGFKFSRKYDELS